MKFKCLLFCAITLLFLFEITNGQNKKKKKEKVTEVTVQADEEIEVMDIELVDNSASFSTSSNFEPISSIRFNNKFEIYGNINDQYDFYCDKYSKEKYSNLGIADKNGNVILPHLFGKSYGSLSNSEVILHINRNYGIFNVNERKWVVPMEYEEMESLGNNLFSAKKNGSWGVIDNSNRVIVPFEWYQINSINGLDNYIIVTTSNYPNRLRGIYSLVDRKLTVPAEYNSLRKLDNQLYFLVNNGSKYNIIDINNKSIFQKWYDEITVPSKGRNYFIVKFENRFGVIDENEKTIIPLEYMEFASYPYSDGSYLARNKLGKYGFILIDGRITLPFEYDNLSKKYNDNVISVQNGKCGLVQVNAGVPYAIVTCDYDDIKAGNKTFIVEKAGKFGLLDIYGKSVTPIEFDVLVALADESYNGIIFKAKKNGFYNLINEQGKDIETEKYLDILPILKKNQSYYSNTKFTFLKALSKNGKYAIIDKVGKNITKPIFDDVLYEIDNNVIVKLNNKQALYSILEQKFILDYDYDLLVKSNDNFYGISDKKIDVLIIKGTQVTKISTTK